MEMNIGCWWKRKYIIANCKNPSYEGVKLQAWHWDWLWKSKQNQAGVAGTLNGINILNERKPFGYILKQKTGLGIK